VGVLEWSRSIGKVELVDQWLGISWFVERVSDGTYNTSIRSWSGCIGLARGW
jgi:hypothetical protein